eukprot:jgi/Tetstr1/445955/TSEL_033582.t1
MPPLTAPAVCTPRAADLHCHLLTRGASGVLAPPHPTLFRHHPRRLRRIQAAACVGTPGSGHSATPGKGGRGGSTLPGASIEKGCKGARGLAVSSVVVSLLGTCDSAGAAVPDVMDVLQSVTADSSLAGGALLIAAYVAASVLLLPASVLTLGAGYIFGPLTGTGLVSVGATLGAGAAFLVSRGVARPLVEKRLAGNEKLAAVDRAVAAKGAQVVLLLRLSPLFPFSLLNYGLGLSQVRFWPYLGASWAGMLPGTFAYVYLGSLGRATVDAAAGGGDGMSSVKLALYAVGAAATLAVTKVVSGAAADALEEAEGNGEGTDE